MLPIIFRIHNSWIGTFCADQLAHRSSRLPRWAAITDSTCHPGCDLTTMHLLLPPLLREHFLSVSNDLVNDLEQKSRTIIKSS